MTDFALRLTYKPRQHGDMGPWPPERGTCSIEEDGCAFHYRVKRGERKVFRQWATDTFSSGLTLKRIRGKWPCYWVENL